MAGEQLSADEAETAIQKESSPESNEEAEKVAPNHDVDTRQPQDELPDPRHVLDPSSAEKSSNEEAVRHCVK